MNNVHLYSSSQKFFSKSKMTCKRLKNLEKAVLDLIQYQWADVGRFDINRSDKLLKITDTILKFKGDEGCKSECRSTVKNAEK